MTGVPLKWAPAADVKPPDRTAHLNAQPQEYFGMYNDRPQVDDGASFGAGLSKNDTRAQASGPAAWASPLTHIRHRWDEKYVPESAAGFDPTSQSEMRGGLTADERDALLAEKEGGGKAFAGEMVHERGVAKGAPRSPFAKAAEPVYSQRLTLADRTFADSKPPLKPTAETASPAIRASARIAAQAATTTPKTQHGYGNSRPVHDAYWDQAKKKLLQMENAKGAGQR